MLKMRTKVGIYIRPGIYHLFSVLIQTIGYPLLNDSLFCAYKYNWCVCTCLYI